MRHFQNFFCPKHTLHFRGQRVTDVANSLPITFIPIIYKISQILILRFQSELFPDMICRLVQCVALRANFMYYKILYL